MKVPLTEREQAALTFQAYPPAQAIQGVWQHPLVKHRSGNGAFMEYARLDEAGRTQGTPTPLAARQVSVSWAEPGRLNAFHVHTKIPQDEIWTVLNGQLTVWLVDCRAGSPTAGHRRQFVLSGEQPTQLHIPAGVAHGYRAGSQGATLLYAMNQQFDPADPNEGRLPWNAFGEELWTEDRG
ncbi:MAG TPA: dTDP-4-dehydrorhamnose 3,5-epimerase family protein [Deinococcales bacterium]|nr:dTDP-4-dehydrorhamnose 3,5-epimerase family protein [Deinococcales bacterium]